MSFVDIVKYSENQKINYKTELNQIKKHSKHLLNKKETFDKQFVF
tara:strand:- start:190 stop:324 length:135 start_codon:yes stop_codon:yes gene_type:complete